MSPSLLSTKLFAPPTRANYIERPRLTEELLSSLHQQGNFALLSGPAGFGKTTLLSDFVRRLQKPVAWVSLDEGDNDFTRFWTYVISACQFVVRNVGKTALELISTPQPLPDDAVPTILINDFVSSDGSVVLVLDDYHEIQTSSIHASLEYLIEHLPDNLYIVISTRIDPPWPLARYRARNQLTEIRVQDLRFTLEETANFLNRTMGLKLSTEDVAALEKRTEGWIAGLQLAALSMQGRDDISAFVKAFTGSNVYVAEYLVEEVLKRQPEDIQTFLLRTSILERLNARLCEAVSELQEGQAILTALHRANIFIISLDDEGRWFRYHRLFADLLQARLRQSVSSNDFAALHKRAAAWYQENNFEVDAVNHALAAQDLDGAARLVAQYAFLIMTRGELTTLLRWVESLPAELVANYPKIIVAKAWTLALAGAIRQVEPLLQQVESWIKEDDRSLEALELLGNIAAIRAFFAMMMTDYPRALELAERADTILPESSVHARWLLPYTLGAAHRGQGQYNQALDAFARQARMGEEYDNLIVWATGVTEVAIVQRQQGRLHAAGETCRQALQRMAERGAARFGSLAKIEVPLVEVLREQNHLEEAYRRATDVIARMQAWPMPTDRIFALLALNHVQQAQGNLANAYETLQIARELKATHPVLLNLARSVDLCEIELSLASGNVGVASRLIDELQPGSSRTVSLRERELSLLARVRLAQGSPDEAEKILSPLASEAETDGHKGALIETLVLQACVMQAKGDREAALTILNKALTLAEPESYVRVFVDEGQVMQNLLVALARQLASTTDQVSLTIKTYITSLLEAFQENRPTEPATVTSEIESTLIEPLTPRELEVLELIASGDSNQAIADKLVITLSAVKKHAGNIFGKLNVSNRTQAVARARQLGLLSPDI